MSRFNFTNLRTFPEFKDSPYHNSISLGEDNTGCQVKKKFCGRISTHSGRLFRREFSTSSIKNELTAHSSSASSRKRPFGAAASESTSVKIAKKNTIVEEISGEEILRTNDGPRLDQYPLADQYAKLSEALFENLQKLVGGNLQSLGLDNNYIENLKNYIQSLKNRFVEALKFELAQRNPELSEELFKDLNKLVESLRYTKVKKYRIFQTPAACRSYKIFKA